MKKRRTLARYGEHGRSARVFLERGHERVKVQWREGGAPFGLFLTSEGRLFVADGRADWVKVLDLQGKAIGRWGEKGTGPGQFRMPHAVCVDRHGAVYVADWNDSRTAHPDPDAEWNRDTGRIYRIAAKGTKPCPS